MKKKKGEIRERRRGGGPGESFEGGEKFLSKGRREPPAKLTNSHGTASSCSPFFLNLLHRLR